MFTWIVTKNNILDSSVIATSTIAGFNSVSHALIFAQKQRELSGKRCFFDVFEIDSGGKHTKRIFSAK